MSDPVSIVGTAVGITSLGIQLCQAIVQYYAQYQSFDEDIHSVVTRTQVLEMTLEALESVKKKNSTKDGVVSKQLELAIESCAGSLMTLKIMTLKLGEINLPNSTEGRRRLLKKKLLWPFRQETLVKLGHTLNELQSNVQLAIQVLQMDVGRDRFEAIQSDTKSIVLRGNQIENHLNKHTRQLGVIQEDLRMNSCNQDQQTLMLSQITLQLASMEQHFIRSNHNTGHNIVLLDPAGYSTVKQSSASDKTHDQSLQKKWDGRPVTPACTCRKRTTTLWWKRFTAGIEITASQGTEHRPNCPYFRHGRTSYNIQGRFTTLTNFLGFRVELGLSYSTMPGRSSIYPIISVSREVSDDSPMFALFRPESLRAHCTCRMYLGELVCNCSLPKNDAQTLLQTITSSLLQILGDGIASPLDTLSGSSISHSIFGLIIGLLVHRHIDAKTATNFLDKLFASGIIHNERDVRGRRPLEYAIGLYEFSHDLQGNPGLEILEVYTYSIQKFGYWPYQSDRDDTFKVYNLLQVEYNLNLYEHDCSLISALIDRSETSLASEIEAHGACKYRHSENDVIVSAIGWVQGLRMLLESGRFSPSDNLKDQNPWKFDSFTHVVFCALQDKHIESLDMLAQAGYPIYPHIWIYTPVLYSHPVELLTLAHTWQTAPEIRQGATGPVSVPDRALGFVYTQLCLPVESANYLWNAGFTNLGLVDPFISSSSILCGPALWVQATKLFTCDLFLLDLCIHFNGEQKLGVRWYFMKWLVDRGARLDWMHPEFRTTPAHMIAASFQYHVAYPAFSTQQPDLDFIKKVLSLDLLDSCDCICSEAGCQVIGCATKEIPVNLISMKHRRKDEAQWKAIVYGLVDSSRPRGSSKGLAVIRVLTFEALNLTHTCCWRICSQKEIEFLDPITEEEIHDIRYIESADIEIFHDLMEEFDEAWGNHRGSFEEFVDNTWSPRIERVREEAPEYGSGYVEEVKRIGVRLWEPFGPQAVE